MISHSQTNVNDFSLHSCDTVPYLVQLYTVRIQYINFNLIIYKINYKNGVYCILSRYIYSDISLICF